jgi:hypothetical protein
LAEIKKSSPLKPLGQMNRNIVGSIYGRSSLKIAYFFPIRYQTWPPQTILVSDWLIFFKIFFSVTAWPNESKFGRNHPWKVLYNDCSFSFNPLTNMAATGNYRFLSVDLKKIVSSETTWPYGSKLGSKHPWMVLY